MKEVKSLYDIGFEHGYAKAKEEVEPAKHGRWIHDGHHIRCSNCEVYFCDKDREGDTLPTNYCPNCGAKMDEVEE